MTLFISYGRAIFVRRKAFLSLLLPSRGSLVSSRHPRKGPTKMQQALNPAIYEFTCLFPYLILFLKTNPVNKQISYPRLCKTNQLTRDSESKRCHKISNAEFRTCSGFTWKMPDPSWDTYETQNKNKSKQLNKHKRLDVMLHRSKVLAVEKT